MGKAFLSVLLVGFLAGCAGLADGSQFAPSPVRTPNSVEAPAAAAAEDDGLKNMKNKFSLDDEGITLRIVLDYVMEEADQETVFEVIRCNHCG